MHIIDDPVVGSDTIGGAVGRSDESASIITPSTGVPIGGSREGPGGTCLDNWTVPLLHRFHGRFMGGPRGHVRPKPYWIVTLLRGL